MSSAKPAAAAHEQPSDPRSPTLTLAETIGLFIEQGDTFCLRAGPPPAGGNYTCGYAAIRDSWEGASDELRKAHRAFFDAGDLMGRIGYVLAQTLSTVEKETAALLLRFLDTAKRTSAVEASQDWPVLRSQLEVIRIRPASAATPAWTPAGVAAGRQRAKGAATPASNLGAPPQYDPAADDAYLADYRARPAEETAQAFEARRGDEPGTVEKTQARVRYRKAK